MLCLSSCTIYNWPSLSIGHPTVTIMNHCCYYFAGLWKVKVLYVIIMSHTHFEVKILCSSLNVKESISLIGDFGVLPPLLISVEWKFSGRASWTLNHRNITMFSSKKRPKMEDQSVYLNFLGSKMAWFPLKRMIVLLYVNIANVCSLF